jgi:ribonuclease HIII
MSHTTLPRLARAKLTSFVTNDIEALSTWLCDQGYSPVAPKQHEAARLIKRGVVIVLYASGSVVVQGTPVTPTLNLLGALADMTEPPTAQMSLFDQGRAA